MNMKFIKPSLEFIKKNTNSIVLISGVLILLLIIYFYKCNQENFDKEISYDLKTDCPDDTLEYPEIFQDKLLKPFDASELENTRVENLYQPFDTLPQPINSSDF